MTDFDDELDDNKPLPGAIDEPAAQQAVTQLLKALGEDSYRDLSGIGIPTAKKCKALARDSLSLLAYVK